MGDFTWANLIGLAALMFTGLSALLGVWWKIETRIREVESKAKHDLRNTEQVYQGKIEKVTTDLVDFKLTVAREYVTHNNMKESEKRLSDRIDDLSDQMRAMPDLVVERITKFLAMRA